MTESEMVKRQHLDLDEKIEEMERLKESIHEASGLCQYRNNGYEFCFREQEDNSTSCSRC